MSLLEQNQRIIGKYREANQPWPATKNEIAKWAILNKLWEIHPAKVIRQCAEQIGEAMREVSARDPQGRVVRVLFAAPYETQGKLEFRWDDMRTATNAHMEASFAHSRNQIANICYQLKTAIDSYNENYNTGRPVQGHFDFRDDLIEMELGSKQDRAA